VVISRKGGGGVQCAGLFCPRARYEGSSNISESGKGRWRLLLSVLCQGVLEVKDVPTCGNMGKCTCRHSHVQVNKCVHVNTATCTRFIDLWLSGDNDSGVNDNLVSLSLSAVLDATAFYEYSNLSDFAMSLTPLSHDFGDMKRNISANYPPLSKIF
jgi:hypothetical protein